MKQELEMHVDYAIRIQNMRVATNHNATMLKSAQADQETIAEQARIITRLERELELARAP